MAAASSTTIDISPLVSAPELKRCVVTGVEQTGRILGRSHYGEIEELMMSGTRVAGKRLNTTSSRNKQKLLERFVSECELLNKLRHPNIVQFYGLCFLSNPRVHLDTQQPVMITEHIENDLYQLLDTQANIHLLTKTSILLDVAKGLYYLHSHDPPVVHRDLTSSNILLANNLQAKICGLGNAYCSSYSRSHGPLTSFPGTLVYMPPEAGRLCSPELDIFSFGVIVLHTVTQVFPGDLPAPKYTAEGHKKSKVMTRTELERRAPYLEIAYGQLGEDHILSKMMHKCLQNLPKDRPTANRIMHQLEAVQAMLRNREEAGSEPTTVQLRRAVRFDGVPSRSTDVEKAEMRIRHQSMSYMHTHVLHGHPSVLSKFKQGGGGFGKRKTTGDWQQFVFKIVDNSLQCLTLRERLQRSISLSEVKDIKAHRSSNNQIFPFYVYFDGKDSPWILSAYSEEERRCWMEAIKPGSTHNQWSDPFPHTPKDGEAQKVRTISTMVESLLETDCPIPGQSTQSDFDQQSGKHASGVQLSPSEGQPALEVDIRGPTPPPRSEISLRCESYDPYVKANEVLFQPDNRSSMSGKRRASFEHTNMESSESVEEGDNDPIYLKILPPDEPRCCSGPHSPKHHSTTTESSGLASDIVSELKEQFTPSEIDLLVKMFEKISAGTKSCSRSKERRKSMDTTMFKEARVDDSVTSLHAHHSSGGLYFHLASLVQDLEPPEDDNVEQTIYPQEKMSEHVIDVASSQESSYKAMSVSSGESVPSESVYFSPKKETSKESNFLRKNAVRQRKQKSQKPRETVTNLSKLHADGVADIASLNWDQALIVLMHKYLSERLLKRASSEDFLEDMEGNTTHPVWSKADTKEDDICRFGQSPVPTKEEEVCILSSDLQGVVNIAKGQHGVVYKATLLRSVDVVLKNVEKSLATRDELKGYMHDLRTLMKSSHPNVCNFYGLVLETKQIAMTYYPNGDIKCFLKKNRRTTDQVVKYMLDVAMGMSHITDTLRLVHKNLAAHNVYITEKEVCQVADMDIGLAHPSTEHRYNPFKVRWMAPESLLNGHYSPASDVWSYGITIWEMLSPTSQPYGDLDAKQCLEHITKGYQLALPPACPDIVGRIMKACWLQSPQKRPSFLYISQLLSGYWNK